MTREYTEEKLQEIEDRLMSGLEADEAREQEIDDLSLSIARRIINEATTESFMGTPYKWALLESGTGKQKVLTVFCYDILKFKIAGLKYRPLQASNKLILQMTFEQNVATLVKSLLYHKAGITWMEESSDNEEA